MENVNCLRCRFRHEDNGNCTAVGGFCTAVPAAHCPLLRQYLDTGLTPERCAEFARADAEGRYIVMRDAEQEGVARLRELAEADKDGRVVVLPVKPVLTHTISSMLYIIEDEEIYEDSLYEGIVGMSERGEMNVIYGTIDALSFEQNDIGRTVFLTREEAERALEVEHGDQ